MRYVLIIFTPSPPAFHTVPATLVIVIVGAIVTAMFAASRMIASAVTTSRPVQGGEVLEPATYLGPRGPNCAARDR